MRRISAALLAALLAGALVHGPAAAEGMRPLGSTGSDGGYRPLGSTAGSEGYRPLGSTSMEYGQFVGAGPVDFILEEFGAICAQDGGELEAEDWLEVVADVNFDGLSDRIIDLGALYCSVDPNIGCGAAGCGFSLWLAQPDGDHVEALRTPAFDHEYFLRKGRPVLQLEEHGSVCGRPGHETCWRSYLVLSDRVEPLD